MKRIEFIRDYPGAGYFAGDVRDVEDSYAWCMVSGGFAAYLGDEPRPAETGPAPAPPPPEPEPDLGKEPLE